MDAADESTLTAELYEAVRQLPGFQSAKEYRAADGEVVFLPVFETMTDLERWRDHPIHLAAKRRWAEFYAGYRIQLAEVTAEYGPGPPAASLPG